MTIDEDQVQETFSVEKSVEEMEVSIYVILGSISYNSMKLLGKIGTFSVEILMDSKSTYNFLDLVEDFVRKW